MKGTRQKVRRGSIARCAPEQAYSPARRTQAEIERIITCYPRRRAALLPVLHLVQQERGWLEPAALKWVARRLRLAESEVSASASFYTMFRLSPPARHTLEICTNIPCSLLGAEHLRDYLARKLKIKPGEITADGGIALKEVECLGSCGNAPVMLVDGVYHENLNRKQIDSLLSRLRGRRKEKTRG